MKVEDARKAFYDFSAKTNEIVRNLSFAGIAVIWIFKIETDGKQLLPLELLVPAGLIVVSLALDLLHYITGILVWWGYTYWHEKRNTPDSTDFTAPFWINYPGNALFWLKVIAMIMAYWYILKFLFSRFS